jgi:MOSC domain-containing protein YiiM
MHIEHIYISSGHNYVGRHGKEPERHMAIEVSRAQCVADQGIVGDRFFGHKEGYKGQITFFSVEVFERLCSALRLSDASPNALRRNVVVSGVDLNELIGRRFTICETEFEGVEECRPCYWMDQALAPGAEEFLKGFGGLRARVQTDGFLTTGRTCFLRDKAYALSLAKFSGQLRLENRFISVQDGSAAPIKPNRRHDVIPPIRSA